MYIEPDEIRLELNSLRHKRCRERELLITCEIEGDRKKQDRHGEDLAI